VLRMVKITNNYKKNGIAVMESAVCTLSMCHYRLIKVMKDTVMTALAGFSSIFILTK